MRGYTVRMIKTFVLETEARDPDPTRSLSKEAMDRLVTALNNSLGKAMTDFMIESGEVPRSVKIDVIYRINETVQ